MPIIMREKAFKGQKAVFQEEVADGRRASELWMKESREGFASLGGINYLN